MEIYIKPAKKVFISMRKSVYLKDVAEIYTKSRQKSEINNLIVLQIKEDAHHTEVISVIDIIKLLDTNFPGNTVINVGENNIVVDYTPRPKKDTKFINFMKIMMITIITFIGSATAIMSFNSEGQIPRILENFYYIFFRKNEINPAVVTIPYSVGICLGIIIFFNHFSKAKLTIDPSPIEVEMTTYEKETIESIIDNKEREGT
ncbi:MAG: stage V sporulation protein AA [Firmicutes bacterium]|nr:stage V sporulation protein AA [Bacillota bacterium]